jgi:hypothetical protein
MNIWDVELGMAAMLYQIRKKYFKTDDSRWKTKQFLGLSHVVGNPESTGWFEFGKRKMHFGEFQMPRYSYIC